MSKRQAIKTKMCETSNLLDDLNDQIDEVDDTLTYTEAALIPHRRPNVRDAFNHLFADLRYDHFIRTKSQYKASSKYRKAQALVDQWKQANEAIRKNNPELAGLYSRRKELSSAISKANKLFYKLERDLECIEDSEIAFIPEEEQEPDEPEPLEELKLEIRDVPCASSEDMCVWCRKNRAILKSSDCMHAVSCYACSDKCSKCPSCRMRIDEFTFTV